ncbi:putative phage-type endonuclease [Haloactinospora alba]|uniref:Putative phage-type endonuclease n=1 Tax=Haloactinospora alba TaxID=405555 RepID=A0A543N6P7_9ACTN|nr:YqaJ viral recombinase family protein [Haloactinospora alba]TQN27496.1 putative phage-type endonuclease [Haloactinospora alba]
MLDAHRLPDHSPGSAEWHEQRRGRIGGSDIAPVMGLSPYLSAFSLWHQKAGLEGGPADTPSMEWGRRLEEPVAQKWAAEHPECDVQWAGAYVHAERDWQLATPDRLVLTPDGTVEVLEIKTSRSGDEWGTSGSDEIPVHYRAQVLWYLDALGLSQAHVAVLIGGSDYREYTIALDRDDPVQHEETQLMRKAAESFLYSIESGERPSIDGADSTVRTVRRLPDGVDDVTVTITDELADEYVSARDAESRAKSHVNETKARILDAIGNATRAARPDGRRVATRTIDKSTGETKSLSPARS